MSGLLGVVVGGQASATVLVSHCFAYLRFSVPARLSQFPPISEMQRGGFVKKVGFRTAEVLLLTVNVAKSYTLDFKMELGQLAEVVQVEAGARVELQTTDATVGNVLPSSEIQNFPALTRQVNELLTLQPGATPTGEITGARSDQSSFMLDGIDVTNNSVGGLGTFAFLPIDSIDEFRVSVANPNAEYGRGAGGQVSLVSRSGTDQYHGSTYWYHQNDNLNANSWDNNRLKLAKPELKDNRFGARRRS